MDTIAFNTQLKGFESIGLTQLDQVSLLDRMDTKYVFHINHLPVILGQLHEHYYILDINGQRSFNYNSLYYDTDDFQLYQHHATGRMNRYKVRLRRYVESSLSYFEVKYKNNKGRTVKKRLKLTEGNDHEPQALSFLSATTPYTFENLKARFWVNYIRITLVSRDYSERLTIDLDLTYINNDVSVKPEGLVIAEVKQGRAGTSAFTRIMKEHHIRPGSLSKYCYGVVSLYNSVRKNRFKPQMLHLNKILNGSAARN
jgi:SPX domain protein involved in polyphosphate accumulation